MMTTELRYSTLSPYNQTDSKCSAHQMAVDKHNLDCVMLDLYRWIGTSIMTIGTVGHVMSVLVILSRRSFRTQSFGVYIVALSLGGLLAIYTGLLRWVIMGFTQWDVDIRDDSKLVCYTHTMLTYFGLQFISWIQATISLDRVFHVAIPVWYPRLRIRRCTGGRALIIVSVEFILALGINMLLLLIMNYDSDQKLCEYLSTNASQIWSWIDLVSFSLIPSAIVLVCNLLLLFIVLRHKVESANENKRASKMRRSLTIMLMSVNLIFLITTVPVSIIQLIGGEQLDAIGRIKLELGRTICYLIQYFGIAITFFIYCLSGSKFRESLVQCKSKRLLKSRSETRCVTIDYDLSGDMTDHHQML